MYRMKQENHNKGLFYHPSPRQLRGGSLIDDSGVNYGKDTSTKNLKASSDFAEQHKAALSDVDMEMPTLKSGSKKDRDTYRQQMAIYNKKVKDKEKGFHKQYKSEIMGNLDDQFLQAGYTKDKNGRWTKPASISDVPWLDKAIGWIPNATDFANRAISAGEKVYNKPNLENIMNAGQTLADSAMSGYNMGKQLADPKKLIKDIAIQQGKKALGMGFPRNYSNVDNHYNGHKRKIKGGKIVNDKFKYDEEEDDPDTHINYIEQVEKVLPDKVKDDAIIDFLFESGEFDNKDLEDFTEDYKKWITDNKSKIRKVLEHEEDEHINDFFKRYEKEKKRNKINVIEEPTRVAAEEVAEEAAKKAEEAAKKAAEEAAKKAAEEILELKKERKIYGDKGKELQKKLEKANMTKNKYEIDKVTKELEDNLKKFINVKLKLEELILTPEQKADREAAKAARAAELEEARTEQEKRETVEKQRKELLTEANQIIFGRDLQDKNIRDGDIFESKLIKVLPVINNSLKDVENTKEIFKYKKHTGEEILATGAPFDFADIHDNKLKVIGEIKYGVTPEWEVYYDSQIQINNNIDSRGEILAGTEIKSPVSGLKLQTSKFEGYDTYVNDAGETINDHWKILGDLREGNAIIKTISFNNPNYGMNQLKDNLEISQYLLYAEMYDNEDKKNKSLYVCNLLKTGMFDIMPTGKMKVKDEYKYKLPKPQESDYNNRIEYVSAHATYIRSKDPKLCYVPFDKFTKVNKIKK